MAGFLNAWKIFSRKPKPNIQIKKEEEIIYWTRLPLHPYLQLFAKGLYIKGLEKPRLVELTGAGFNYAWTTTKAAAPCVEARLVDYIKGICSHGS